MLVAVLAYAKEQSSPGRMMLNLHRATVGPGNPTFHKPEWCIQVVADHREIFLAAVSAATAARRPISDTGAKLTTFVLACGRAQKQNTTRGSRLCVRQLQLPCPREPRHCRVRSSPDQALQQL